MAELLKLATEVVAPLIDLLALAAILMGTVEAAWRTIATMFSARATNHEKRQIWLHYARWLVAALTFQLAADIVETAVAPTWDDIGRLAAIAAVRTFLNFFLERDLNETRKLDDERLAATSK